MSNGLPADYHVHTFLCKHAEGLPGDYVAAARKMGIPELCFTDHAPAPDGYDAGNRMTIDRFPDYAALVSDLRANPGPPNVLYGIEADYYPAGNDFLREWLPRHGFDVVLGSIHFMDDWGFDHPDNIDRWDRVDVTETWRTYFRLLGELADTRLFDVVSHMDITKKFGYRPAPEKIADIAQPALDRIAAAGMAVELNTGGLHYPAGEIYPSLLLLTMCRERDIPIVFGSDAHRPETVGRAFDEAVTLARQAGYTHCLRFRHREGTAVPLPVDRTIP